MEKLLESYKILSYLGSQIFFFIEVHKTYTENETKLNEIKFSGHYANLPFAKAISGNLLNYSLIIANSYFDEYNENFVAIKHPKFEERIKKVRAIIKPVIKRLNKWTNFKDHRNYILAHNFRIKGQSIFANDFKPFHFKVPHTNSEIILLAEMVRLVNITIAAEFSELLDDNYYKDTVLDKMRFYYNEVDINNELDEMINQMNEIRSKLAK
jgi:hypothetical protein